MTSESQNIESTPSVQLFILSRDRVDFCREAVVSAIGQTYANCQVVVSDNSESENVAEMLAKEFPEVVVIRRKPTLPALSHFNILIDEAVSPLMVLFHDDDVLEPEYVDQMVSLFQQHPEVAAVGCNAKILRGISSTGLPFMGAFRGTVKLRRPFDLLEPYLSISLTSPAPFPGYMYRTSIIRGLGLNAEYGGKHADVSFLANILARGPMVWTSECLFRYRFHGQNDSSKESIADRLRWLRHIYVSYGVHPKSRDVIDYKFLYWIKWLQQNSLCHTAVTHSRNRRRTASRFVRNLAFRMAITRLDFWKRILRDLRSRIMKLNFKGSL